LRANCLKRSIPAREDALDGAVAMLNRASAVPTPEKGTRNRHQTVTSAGGPKRAVGKRLGC